MSKLRSSTFFWAASMRRDTMRLSMAWPSSMPRRVSMLWHPLAGEDAHQVVFERQVEAAGARIALPAGAAAKLVVDAAGLVPLGADDVQAAHLGDLAALFLHLLLGLDLLDGALPHVFGHVEAGGILVLEPGPGQGLGVAAEDDVGAAAGHVGGDGDGADAAGLGDDLRLAAGELRLGVEQLVLDALALEHGR